MAMELVLGVLERMRQNTQRISAVARLVETTREQNGNGHAVVAYVQPVTTILGGNHAPMKKPRRVRPR